jgi:hypothetical protein
MQAQKNIIIIDYWDNHFFHHYQPLFTIIIIPLFRFTIIHRVFFVEYSYLIIPWFRKGSSLSTIMLPLWLNNYEPWCNLYIYITTINYCQPLFIIIHHYKPPLATIEPLLSLYWKHPPYSQDGSFHVCRWSQWRSSVAPWCARARVARREDVAMVEDGGFHHGNIGIL